MAPRVEVLMPNTDWTHQRIRDALRLSRPFFECPAPYIQADTSSSPLQHVPCRSWPLLVLAVIDVLHDYFQKLAIIDRFPEEMAQRTQMTIAHLDNMARLFFRTREQNTRSRSAQRYVQEDPLLQKLHEVTVWLQSFSREDYLAGQHWLERARAYPRLCVDLNAAFRTHGPRVHRPTFSREARYRACAAILIHFQLTTGDLTTVAETFGRYVRNARPRLP
jgi:hypothetical protein